MRITLTLDFEPHPEVPIQAQMHNALLQWMAADIADGCKVFNARQEWGAHGSKATTETQVSADVCSWNPTSYREFADKQMRSAQLATAVLSSMNFSKGT